MRYTPSRWPRYLMMLLVLVAGLLVALHLAVAPLLRAQLEQALHPQPGQGTYLGDVSVNLFSGLLNVRGLALGEPEAPYFEAAHVLLDVDMGALLTGKLRIEALQIERGFWRVQRRKDGSINPGPVIAVDRSEDKAAMPAFVVEQARVRRWHILYTDQASELGEQNLRVDDLRVEHLDTTGAQAAAWQAKLDWAGAQISAKGQMDIMQGGWDADWVIEQLPLNRVWVLARQAEPVHAKLDAQGRLRMHAKRLVFEGKLSVNKARWQPEGQVLEVGTMALDRLQVDLPLGSPQSLQLSGKGLRWQGVQWQAAEQALQLGDGQLTGAWAYQAEGHRVDLQALSLQLQPSVMQTEQAEVQLGELAATVGATSFPAGAPLVAGDLKLGSSTVRLKAADDYLKMATSQLAEWSWQADKLQLKDLRITGLQVSQPKTDLAAARLSRLHWQPGKLTLGKLHLDSLQAAIKRDAEGQWQLPKAGASKGQQAEGQPLDWSVEGVTLVGASQLALHDASLQPALRQQWQIEHLQLGSLDSQSSEQPTPFALKLKPDAYSQLSLQGEVRPLAEQLTLNLKGELSGLPLAPLNGLISKDLGHEFKSGQVDDEFNLAIEAGKMRMQNALTLIGLDVEVIEGSKGPPLSLAISLLEDRDGKMAFEVPIEGDLSNPDFHVLAALNPIILKAVAGAAALAIQPAGSVLLVGSLLANEALKVSFAPAPFAQHSATLGPKAKKGLDTLAEKLADKPKLKLRLCGLATTSERLLDKQGKPRQSDDELLAIADTRAQAVRAYLMKKGVDEGRLKTCRPALDDKTEGKPRVEIRL